MVESQEYITEGNTLKFHSRLIFSLWELEKISNTEFPLSGKAWILTSRSNSFSRIKLSEDLFLEEKLMGQKYDLSDVRKYTDDRT